MHNESVKLYTFSKIIMIIIAKKNVNKILLTNYNYQKVCIFNFFSLTNLIFPRENIIVYLFIHTQLYSKGIPRIIRNFHLFE